MTIKWTSVVMLKVSIFNFHASTGSKRIKIKCWYRISRSYFQISSFKFNTKYMYLRFLVLWRSQWCDQISSFNVGQKDPTTKCIFFSYGADCRIIMHYAWMNWKEPTKHDSLSKKLYVSSLSSYVLRCEEN